MSADRPSPGARETDSPPPAPPTSQDKPAPQPRDTRSIAEYNRDTHAGPPVQRYRDTSQGAARPDTSSLVSSDTPPAGGGRDVGRARDDAPSTGAASQDRGAYRQTYGDLERNRALIAAGPPMQRRYSSDLAAPDASSRAGTGNDGGTTSHSRADAGPDRSTERASSGADRTGAARWQPEQQGDTGPRGTSDRVAAQGARHDLAGESGAGREHGSQAKTDSTGTGQEPNGPLGRTQQNADGQAAVYEAGMGGSDDRHGMRGSGANNSHDQAAAASDQGNVGILDRGQADAQDGESDHAAAPDSYSQEASKDSSRSADSTSPDAPATATDGQGPVPPDTPGGPINGRDHPDDPIAQPDSGTDNRERERQVLVGALDRLERKDQEIDKLRAENDEVKAERDQFKAENDQFKAENDRLKAELDRLRPKGTQPGENNQLRDKPPADQNGSADIGEPSPDLADRIQHKPDQVTDKVKPEPKRFRLPSDKAVGLFVAANTGIDALAVNAHAISGAVSTNIGIFTGVCAAAIMWGRERWENRRKNGR